MTSVETLGYYHMSLRDEDQILVALGWKPALRWQNRGRVAQMP